MTVLHRTALVALCGVAALSVPLGADEGWVLERFDARKSTGTRTTRRRRQPQSATTHSIRFSDQIATLSSAPMPAASRRAANARAAAATSAYVA